MDQSDGIHTVLHHRKVTYRERHRENGHASQRIGGISSQHGAATLLSRMRQHTVAAGSTLEIAALGGMFGWYEYKGTETRRLATR